MKSLIKTNIVLLLTALSVVACSSNPYNDADSQRERAKQTQDELSRDTSK